MEKIIFKNFKIQRLNVNFDKVSSGSSEVETEISFIADVDKSKRYVQIKMETVINNININETLLEMLSIGEFELFNDINKDLIEHIVVPILYKKTQNSFKEISNCMNNRMIALPDLKNLIKE